MDRLRFATVGSVDDGKSTLIGRLLYDSKSIFEDQLEHIEAVSKRRGDDYVDLSLLTDGLRAEREQGITIDVAYRYFATPKRSFIIADCPGHIQYTRNMITGASNVDLAIVLVDARTGVVEQTRRHSLLCADLIDIIHLYLLQHGGKHLQLLARFKRISRRRTHKYASTHNHGPKAHLIFHLPILFFAAFHRPQVTSNILPREMCNR